MSWFWFKLLCSSTVFWCAFTLTKSKTKLTSTNCNATSVGNCGVDVMLLLADAHHLGVTVCNNVRETADAYLEHLKYSPDSFTSFFLILSDILFRAHDTHVRVKIAVASLRNIKASATYIGRRERETSIFHRSWRPLDGTSFSSWFCLKVTFNFLCVHKRDASISAYNTGSCA